MNMIKKRTATLLLVLPFLIVGNHVQGMELVKEYTVGILGGIGGYFSGEENSELDPEVKEKMNKLILHNNALKKKLLKELNLPNSTDIFPKKIPSENILPEKIHSALALYKEVGNKFSLENESGDTLSKKVPFALTLYEKINKIFPLNNEDSGDMFLNKIDFAFAWKEKTLKAFNLKLDANEEDVDVPKRLVFASKLYRRVFLKVLESGDTLEKFESDKKFDTRYLLKMYAEKIEDKFASKLLGNFNSNDPVRELEKHLKEFKKMKKYFTKYLGVDIATVKDLKKEFAQDDDNSEETDEKDSSKKKKKK